MKYNIGDKIECYEGCMSLGFVHLEGHIIDIIETSGGYNTKYKVKAWIKDIPEENKIIQDFIISEPNIIKVLK